MLAATSWLCEPHCTFRSPASDQPLTPSAQPTCTTDPSTATWTRMRAHSAHRRLATPTIPHASRRTAHARRRCSNTLQDQHKISTPHMPSPDMARSLCLRAASAPAIESLARTTIAAAAASRTTTSTIAWRPDGVGHPHAPHALFHTHAAAERPSGAPDRDSLSLSLLVSDSLVHGACLSLETGQWRREWRQKARHVPRTRHTQPNYGTTLTRTRE